MIGSATSVRVEGRSPNSSHAVMATKTTCRLLDHDRQAGADVGDRVVPCQQVSGEKDAREGRPAPAAGRQRPACTALDVRGQEQDRQAVEGAKERARLGADSASM